MTDPVVIIGASMGGLRAAESLRRFGYAGELVVVGDEPYAPYNRPPLSKEVLAAEVSHEAVAFPLRDAVADVRWILGHTAVAADVTAHTVTLDDGSVLPYSQLVIATGLRAKAAELPSGMTPGRFTIRTLDDAMALRAAITPGVRVVVSGGGFVGCETAATVRKLGADVTIVTRSTPLARVLGEEFGREIQRRQEAHGVRFIVGSCVSDVLGDDRVTGVRLDSGQTLECEVLIDAVGSLPNTEWLDGTGIDISNGVRCDEQLRALTPEGTIVADVFAIGDVARFPNPVFDDTARRVEHWNIPTECAKHIGKVIAARHRGEPEPAEPFAPVPSFWSDQFEMHILAFGLPALGTSATLVEGSLDGDCVFEYHRDGQLVGVAGIGLRSVVQGYRSKFMSTAKAA
ncbi:MAG TPA: FAD-dependent oxidoreductase [Microbacteriaceae bacterium]|nr:FAD-dependent oxidoreductase [Microbacteriaceae bacterium]